MDLGLKGKKALVMGGSKGIGLGIAKSLIAEGAQVVICSRNLERLERVSSEIGAQSFFSCDLKSPGAGKKAIETTLNTLQGIDILVTNSGGPPKGSFQELPLTEWDMAYEELFKNMIEAMQCVLKEMEKKEWGRILMVTSTSAKEPIPNLTLSNCYRAGLLGLMKSMCHELASKKITVNAILPGFIDTDRLKTLNVSIDKIQALVPAKRLGNPEEIGDLAAFLASEKASYITGQAISVDGGRTKGI